MLTKIKKIVYIILLSILISSCGLQQEEKDNKVINKTISGYKNKAKGGEALYKGKKVISIGDGIDTDASGKPKFIK